MALKVFNLLGFFTVILVVVTYSVISSYHLQCLYCIYKTLKLKFASILRTPDDFCLYSLKKKFDENVLVQFLFRAS